MRIFSTLYQLLQMTQSVGTYITLDPTSEDWDLFLRQALNFDIKKTKGKNSKQEKKLVNFRLEYEFRSQQKACVQFLAAHSLLISKDFVIMTFKMTLRIFRLIELHFKHSHSQAASEQETAAACMPKRHSTLQSSHLSQPISAVL